MSATPPDTTYPYDVFISYSHADADWVWNWLVPRLKAEGLAVCTDQESFDLGVPSLINMENAVAASRHTLLVLTPAYVGSEWTMYEQILTHTQDPSGLHQRTIPVLRQPCDLPPRIAMLTRANLSNERNGEAEFARLLDAIRGVRRLPMPSRRVVEQPKPEVKPEPPKVEKPEPPKLEEIKPNPPKPEPPKKGPEHGPIIDVLIGDFPDKEEEKNPTELKEPEPPKAEPQKIKRAVEKPVEKPHGPPKARVVKINRAGLWMVLAGTACFFVSPFFTNNTSVANGTIEVIIISGLFIFGLGIVVLLFSKIKD